MSNDNRRDEICADLNEVMENGLIKDNALSPRETRKIVKQAMALPHVCDAVLHAMDNPDSDEAVEEYNDTVNCVLHELTEKLVNEEI